MVLTCMVKCLYHARSCRNSSGYSKRVGNFLSLLIIRLVQKIVWVIFNIISSDACFRIFNLGLWFCCSRHLLIPRGGPPVTPWWPINTQNTKMHNYLLRLPDTYEAKIAKTGNFWTFWPVIQLIYHLFPPMEHWVIWLFCCILKRWFISKITNWDVQKLHIFAIFYS